mmetsp:Transcript_2026/g.4884  ORF Transcript_2026/g.4884 Transcript_2026/m.4884 type:complete len:301 (-) Transcript_2026:119-1021(-)|eukprot:CAMPEP_0117588412 /NCGR_PEP_ID=MMETSP0784-20121206/69840_1 /TAXON_ID=39447 /ORGANISM="" /LENGTH=300 /DNA_ID=CAMNT_0005389775 /DNA_START=152 /DNA_END=1054 /DNA_ORIENTATION=-
MQVAPENESSAASDGAALPFELELSDLKVLRKIGSGHTSEVYRGVCYGRQVAIKQLSMRKVNTTNFTREVGIMSQIDHPNIVKLLGVVLSSQPFQVVMEYCAGGTCFEVLHNNLEVDLASMQLLKMSLHCAVALDYLHNFSPQIIHRDLKSLNLLLEQPISSMEDVPHVKVTDFGLARMLESSVANTSLTVGVGTPYWMAPEVFAGGAYNEKIDVYSYGMVLFEIVFRQIPFEEIEPQMVRKHVLKGNCPTLSQWRDDLPQSLQELMVSCWAFDANLRPTFAQIVGVLQAEESIRNVVSL